MEITLPYKFECRDYQAPFWSAMNQGKKRGCLVWHRRSGKDKTALNFMICKMLDRTANYHYLFPTGKQGRKVIWEGIDRDGMRYMNHFPKELITRKREDEMFIQLRNLETGGTEGSTFQIIGTDNYDAIMGANPAGLIFSEYSLQDPMAWNYLRPILAENEGWAVFLYTPRGENHGFDLYEAARQNPDRWFTELLTVTDTFRADGTPVITEEIINQERAEGMTENMVQQEFYCSFLGAIEGAYYGRLMVQAKNEGPICNLPHDPASSVYTYWDLGFDDSTSIWFAQFIGPEVHWIRYHEDHNKDMAVYIKELERLRVEEGYVYGEHYGPHDIEAHHMATGKSPKDVASALGYTFQVVKRSPNVNHGIQNVRARLPLMWFDEKKTKQGRSCLTNYCQEYDEKTKKWSDRPAKTWAIHGADAMRTYAEGMGQKKGGAGMTEMDAAEMMRKWGPQTAMQS